MTACFFCGTLCHAPLLRAVLGHEPPPARPARLADHAMRWAEGESFALLLPAPGGEVEGRLVEVADVARVDFYAATLGLTPCTVEVALDGGGQVTARAYVARPGLWTPGAPWRLADWAARWGETVVAAAQDAMVLFGQVDPAQILTRQGPMLVRAGARMRARAPMPATLRHAAGPDDIRVDAFRQPYARFFSVEEYDVSWRRFDGSMTPAVTRAAFVSGDAVVVLPYDPLRDRVLVVEQFRMGPFARGDAQPWLLEPVAGRIDGGETPADAARRETEEEAGVTLHRLIEGPSCYASPGAKTEYLYSYVGIVDLPDGVAGTAGLEAETEDIRSHLIPFDRLLELIDSGEADNAPLILLALWLDRKRAALRAEAGAAAAA